MLYPPLVDDDDDDDNNNRGNSSEGENSSSVLSNNLKDRFESMRALLRLTQHAKEDSAELKRKKRQMALETAMLIESEVSRLESGIEELESLLGEQQQQQHFVVEDEVEDEAARMLVFPSFPPIVDEEDDEKESEKEKPSDLVTQDDVLCDN